MQHRRRFQLIAEGVDLHSSCRHVIHHDLAWNPGSIEQRTGRVDRLDCEAENRDLIEVCRPTSAARPTSASTAS